MYARSPTQMNVLGKRKREVAVVTRQRERTSDDSEPAPAAASDVDQDIFRKYFESTFEPLPESHIATSSLSDEEEEDDNDEIESAQEESSWEGLSDVENTHASVEIVEHRTLEEREDAESRRQQYKTFMSTKPPKEVEQAASRPSDKEADDEDAFEAQNLKHDLDLQRLLKESHLLEQAKSSPAPGTQRHKAVDMRMQSLGSKDSLFHQEKMPLSHRKGILAKATSREAVRRKEAKENGIILEKPSGKARSIARRERGVDVPAVGRFRGGTLKLSRTDILDIQGPARRGGKKGRR